MWRTLFRSLLSCGLLAAISGHARAAEVDLLVQLEKDPGLSQKSLRGNRALDPGALVAAAPELSALIPPGTTTRLETVATTAGRKGPGGGTILRVVMDTDRPAEEVARELRALSSVRHAEPNQRGRLVYTPNDPFFASQLTDLAAIGIEAAWDEQQGANSSVRVAIIDSGIDATHPDLVNVIDFSASFNVAENNSTLLDDTGHGTRIAGIIGAEANNDVGIAGVAFGSTLLVYDVYQPSGTVLLSDVITAMNLAVGDGADVINLSLAFNAYSLLFEEACNNAESAGILVVAAAGNDNQGDLPAYPASYASVLGVGATNDNSTARAVFSNFNGLQGNLVELVAPGTTIFSTMPGTQYNGTFGSGTSFSAPIVAGVGALLKAQNPDQSGTAIRNHLRATAAPIAGFEPFAGQGAGLVNAAAALSTPMAPAIRIDKVIVDDSPAINPANDGDGVLDRGESARIIVHLANDGADAFAVNATLSTLAVAIETLGDNTTSFGTVLSGTGATNEGDPFGLVVVADAAAAQQVLFTLDLSGTGGFSQTIFFELAVEDEVDISGIVASPTVYTADKTWRVVGNLLWRSEIEIEPGTTFKANPGVTIRAEQNANVSAIGTAENPIVFTSAIPTPIGATPPPFGALGPRTEPYDLSNADEVIYVSATTGNDIPGAGTKANPYKSFTYATQGVPQTKGTALQRAYFLVAEGTYLGSGNSRNDVTPDAIVLGGFSPDFEERDIFRYPTIFDGEGNGAAILLSVGNSQLDGCFVVNGGNGGVVGTMGANRILSNCMVIENRGSIGGGIYIERGIQIRNCLIQNNGTNSGGTGSALYITGGVLPVALRNNIIVDNFHLSPQACAFVEGSSGPTIESNLFLNKMGARALSVNSWNGASVRNNLVDHVGGVAFSNSSSGATILANNTILSVNDGILTSTSMVALNNILWNKEGPAIFTHATGSVAAANNIIQGGFPGSTNTITDDPQLAGVVSFGVVLEATYGVRPYQTILTLSSEGSGTAPEPGTMMEIAHRHFFVTEATATQAIVLGDATQKGSISFPNSYKVESYRLTATSPAIGAGVGPAADARVPSLDIDGENRSGATTDIGADLFQGGPSLEATRWGRLVVLANSNAAEFRHVLFENGAGVRVENSSAILDHCEFRNHEGHGLDVALPLTTAITAPLAHQNRGHGINAPGTAIQNAEARENQGTGLIGGNVSGSLALANFGDGINADVITNATARLNGGAGVRAAVSATNVIARSNATGIASPGSAISFSEATENWDVGIDSGSGVLNAVVSSYNGGHGLRAGAVDVQNSTFIGNAGYGVFASSGSTLFSALVANNTLGSATGLQEVVQSRLVNNGAGISNLALLSGSYVAYNAGDGASASQVQDSAIVGNSGRGVVLGSSLTNSWIAGNGGVGIDGVDGSPTITASTLTGNSGGTRNVASATGSNFLGNSPIEAFDNVSNGTFEDRNFENNFWGAANTALLDGAAVFANMPFVTDTLDQSGNHAIDLWPYATAPVTNAPDTTAPPVIVSVTPNLNEPLNVGPTFFEITFSGAMDTSTTPSLTFDRAAPFTFRVVEPSPGWTSATTWRGVYWIQTDTGDGINTIRIDNARSAVGFLIPADTTHQFVIDTSNPEVANNGLASATGTTITLSWSQYDGTALPSVKSSTKGTVLPTTRPRYRIRRATGTTGSYVILGEITTPPTLPEKAKMVYADGPPFGAELTPDTLYRYLIDVVDEAGNGYQWAAMEARTQGLAEIWGIY